MELNGLNADERIALAGLVKATVMADARLSAEERDDVQDIVEALGEDSYRQAMDAVDTRFPDEDSFKRFLQTIVRPDARELIYATVLDAAVADAVEGHESALLSWLEGTWKLEVSFAE